MFTPDERQRLRDSLIEAAHQDPRVTGAALTGSGALGHEDDWSDIDLALCVTDHDPVLADWTGRMYREHDAVHHLDVRRGTVLFRVFLLASSLQVDIAFWPPEEFGAIAPTFRLLFGTANDLPHTPPPDAEELVGLGWLYALHARSSIARGRCWQAEYMISNLRGHVLVLACLRHGVPAVQGRGLDDLPPEATIPDALVRSLDEAELLRAFRVAAEALLAEAGFVDSTLAGKLAGPLRTMTFSQH